MNTDDLQLGNRNRATARQRLFDPYRMQQRLVLVLTFFCLALSPTFADTALALRGRPVFSEGTLLSDNGSPLRGPQYALDVHGVEPPEGWIEALPSRGANALHVYAESIVFTEKPGDNHEDLMAIVDRAAASDLYLVITIGGHPEAGCYPQENPWEQFAFAFWKRYARVLGSEPHVIFELQNEAWFECGNIAQPSPDHVIKFEAQAYSDVRMVAPNTPILLFSYAFLHSSAGVLNDIDALDVELSTTGHAPIDWTKTGIAFHGYAQAEATESVIRELAELPVEYPDYGLVETELAICPHCEGALQIPLVIAYETTRTSWLSFLPLDRVGNARWNNILNAASVVWAADQGSWPGTSTPPLDAEIALFSPVGRGAYVRVDLADGQLIADATAVSSVSRFEVGSSGRYVTLKSKANGKYVRRGADDRLRADSLLPAEFEWIDLPDGKVTLQAKSNWRFVGADYNASPAVLVGNRPLEVDPPVLAAAWERFEVEILTPSHTLTVSTVGSGSGTVSSLPAGIDCGDDCSEDYAQGTPVSLTPDPDVGSQFDGWSGHVDCGDGQVTMHADRNCVATFLAVEPTCGGLSQEAEDGVLTDVFEVRTEGSRTYIEVPDRSIGDPQAPNDAWKASYCVTVPSHGTYHIEAKVRAPDFDADSFYVRVDGQPVFLWLPRPLGAWTTDLVNDTLPDPDVDPLEITLDAGEHTLEFLLREDGTQLDAFTMKLVVQ